MVWLGWLIGVLVGILIVLLLMFGFDMHGFWVGFIPVAVCAYVGAIIGASLEDGF